MFRQLFRLFCASIIRKLQRLASSSYILRAELDIGIGPCQEAIACRFSLFSKPLYRLPSNTIAKYTVYARWTSGCVYAEVVSLWYVTTLQDPNFVALPIAYYWCARPVKASRNISTANCSRISAAILHATCKYMAQGLEDRIFSLAALQHHNKLVLIQPS